MATWLKCFQTVYLDPKSVNGYVVMASVNYYAFWELFESQYLSLNIMILCLLCHRWDKGNLCKKEHEDLSFLLFWNGTANGKLWGLSYTTNRNGHLNVFLYSIHILFNTARKAVINCHCDPNGYCVKPLTIFSNGHSIPKKWLSWLVFHQLGRS